MRVPAHICDSYHDYQMKFLLTITYRLSGKRVSFESIISMNHKTGKIDISQLNNPPEKHELETAKFFANRGKDVVFIRPSNIPNIHTPDIIMDGVEWEIKCPEGKGKRTIEKSLEKGETQSRNIIIDLRWIKIHEKQCISQIKLNFNTKTKIKRMFIITKGLRLIELPEKD